MNGINEREADLIIKRIDDLNTAMQDGFKSIRSEIETRYDKTDGKYENLAKEVAEIKGSYISHDKVWKTLIAILTLLSALLGTIYLFIEKSDSYEKNRINEEVRKKTTTTTTKRLKHERVFIWGDFNCA